MSKFILFLAFTGLAFLAVFSIVAPTDPAVWLASTSHNFVLIRAGLMALIFALLVTNPPRNIYFRVFVGLLSVGLTSWALYETYNNQIKILDSFSILAASISTGIVALEAKLVTFEFDESVQKQPVSTTKLSKQLRTA